MESYSLHNFIPGEYLGDISYNGIEGFVSALNHEVEHWKLKEDLWKTGGYDTADDCDKDGYPDSWEMFDPIAINYGFDPKVKDVYNSGYDLKNLKNFGAPTWYEETKCSICQTTKNNIIINDLDWSYDKTGEYQGKQW